MFDEQNVLDKLTRLGNPLIVINAHVDFKVFLPLLEKISGRKQEITKPSVGRPAYDLLTMMKILFLQQLYNLSDEQVEYQINDRLSFRRFLEIPFRDATPDCKTVWAFREQLNAEGEVRTKELFNLFLEKLNNNNLIAKEGVMVDVTLVSVPIQRNNRDENKQIKQGNIPTSFSKNQNKASQKNTDALWTKKNNVSFYGYKNHIKGETKRKFITNYIVTDASVHDSQVACELLTQDDKGQCLYADSAYPTQELKAKMKELKMQKYICEKGVRGKPLTEGQKQDNRKKSKTRCRVEHIFGFMTTSTNDATFIRSIEIARAKISIVLINLTYNICRFVQLKKLGYA